MRNRKVKKDRKIVAVFLLLAVFISSVSAQTPASPANQAAKADLVQRAEEVKNLKFAMFVCWSLSTFSDQEWTSGSTPISTFNPTGCDTDQWARTARAAGMHSILFLTKHHDGFCLWDTKTTDRKVTNSPLGRDVLAEVRKSCDKYGLKLGLYFSEGDWTWPGAEDGKSGSGGKNPELKKAQLQELLTNYGTIDYMFMDCAIGVGGLPGPETNAFIKSLQPGCIVAIEGGEMEDHNNLPPGPSTSGNPNILLCDVSQPLLGLYDRWFYTNPGRDHEVRPADEIFKLYQDCLQYRNLLLLDVGPDHSGRLRQIDVETLEKVGNMIRRSPVPDVNADFYVAPGGKDTNPGTAAEPLATVAGARDAVRNMVAAGLSHNVLVLLREGTYIQTEALFFGPEDSGTDQYSITYAAAPGEKVILSGGRKITGWQKGEGNLWTTQIPAVKNGDWYFRQLFIDGRRAVRARTPNMDDKAPWWHIRTCSITIGDNHPPTDEPIIVSLTGPIQPYRNLSDVELVYIANNNGSRKFLGTVNEAEQTLTLRPPHQWIPRAFGTEWKYSIPDVGLSCYLENAPEMLDQPGEWYLDRQTGLLSYWPLPGEDLNQVEAIAPVVDQTLLALIGTPQQPVVNLHFRGIQLQHTKWDIPATGYMGMAVCTTAVGDDPTPGWQWLPAAVEFKHARSCRFLDGGVAHVGMLGFCLREGTKSITIEGNHVYDIGGGGIGAGYMENAAYGYVHAPSPGPDEFSDYRVANNYVHDCGVEDYAGFGILLGEAKNSIVSHNLIHDTAYFGMAIAGSQLNREAPFAANNSIEFNHIYRAMKITVDGAGMYLTFSQQDRTCLVRGNLLHDITANPLSRRTMREPGPFLAAGIYLDGAAAGYLIQNNVVYSAWGNLFSNGQSPSVFIDNLIQKTAAPPVEFIQVMESLAGLEPPYRKSILNTDTPAYAFYSLEDPADTHWTGYQFHQPAARAGVIILFRRTGSEKDTAQFRMQNLDEKVSYDFKLWQAADWDGQSVLDHIQPVADPATVLSADAGQKTGQQFMNDGLSVKITQVPQILWIVYQQKSR